MFRNLCVPKTSGPAETNDWTVAATTTRSGLINDDRLITFHT